MTKKTWRELEAEGVKRCCAMFNNGKQCRRRAVRDGWCGKHGPVMERITKETNDMLERTKGGNA